MFIPDPCSQDPLHGECYDSVGGADQEYLCEGKEKRGKVGEDGLPVVGKMSQGEEKEGGAKKCRIPQQKRGEDLAIHWLQPKVIVVQNICRHTVA